MANSRGSMALGGPKTPQGSRHLPSSAARHTLDGGQQQQRFSVTMPSTARKSSYVRATTAAFKDTRPMTTPQYKAEMIKKIHEMTELSIDRIKSPSKADFIEMFEIIFGFFDENYVFSGNLEEELPKMMRAIGYPVVVKTANLKTVAAPNALQQNLALLGWLIDLVNIYSTIEVQPFLLDDNDTDGRLSALTLMMEAVKFKEFLKDKQTAMSSDAFREDMIRRLKQQIELNFHYHETMEEKKPAVIQLREQVELLESEPNNCAALDTEIESLQSDNQAMEKYKKDVYQNLESKKADLLAANEALAKQQEEVQQLRAQVQEKRRRLAERTAKSGWDVAKTRNAKDKKKQAEQQVEQLQKELQDLNKTRYAAIPAALSATSAAIGNARHVARAVHDLRSHLFDEEPRQLELPSEMKDLHAAVSGAGKELLHATSQDIQDGIEKEGASMREVTKEMRRVDDLLAAEDVLLMREKKECESAQRSRDADREVWQRKLAALNAENDQLRAEKDALVHLHRNVGNMQFEVENAVKQLAATKEAGQAQMIELDSELTERVAAKVEEAQIINDTVEELRLSILKTYSSLTRNT